MQKVATLGSNKSYGHCNEDNNTQVPHKKPLIVSCNNSQDYFF